MVARATVAALVSAAVAVSVTTVIATIALVITTIADLHANALRRCGSRRNCDIENADSRQQS